MRVLRLISVALVCVFFVVTGAAKAAPLNLTGGRPDVFSSGITVNYNSTTDVFHAFGYSDTVKLVDNSTHSLGIPGSGFSFDLTATINDNGVASAGTLTVTGDYPTAGVFTNYFTSSSLQAFGFGATNKFEFLFSEQGTSTLAGVSPGKQIGTILTFPGSVFAGGVPDFHNSFASTTNNGSADTFAVPLPSSVWGGAFGLAGLVGLRLYRRRSCAAEI